jgi:hypothetical protein
MFSLVTTATEENQYYRFGKRNIGCFWNFVVEKWTMDMVGLMVVRLKLAEKWR